MQSALEQEHFDIVLSKEKLAQFDAFSALVIVQKYARETPLIVISAGCSAQTAVSLLKSGAVDCLDASDLSGLADAVALALSEARRRSAENKAVHTLRESEALYRALVERIPAVVYLAPLKQDEKSLYISPHIERIGYTIEEYNAQTHRWRDRVHPDDRERAIRKYETARATYGADTDDYRVLTRDGSLVWMHDIYWTVRDDEGNPLYLQGIATDITERKQAEEALYKSEERFRVAMEAIQDGLWDWDIPTRLIYTSPGYYRMLGYEPATSVISDEARVELVHPEDRERVQNAFSECAENKIQSFEIEFRMKARDGSYRWILGRGRLLEFDATGRPTRLIGTHIDITERKQVEAELREAHVRLEQRVAERTIDLKIANQSLEKAARLKDEFMASMSHELRTPLTGVLGLSESLRNSTYGELNEKQSKALQMIENSGRHLLTLINDILDLSKIEAGHFELEMAACSLSEVCQASLHLMRGMAHQKKQDVRFSITPAAINLNADARRLKQMLVNLLGNAVKFTPEGGSLGIQVVGNQEEQQVSITVWDKGIGIRKEDLPRLFQPFVQLDSGLSRQYGGTGLGLALVQRLAQMHSGLVKVESSPGLGSRFTILLPWETLKAATSPAAQAVMAQMKVPAYLPTEKSGPRVLIADDNATILEVMCDFLTSRNFQTTGVESGEELLQRISEIDPDILLVDIQMPGMDGLEVIRRVRAYPDPRIAALPVLAVTALAMAGDRERCLQAGANEYISKPVRLEELIDTVNHCLRNPSDAGKEAIGLER
jgi:PAS domain S-box-containing protein